MITHPTASLVKFEAIQMHPDLRNRAVEKLDDLIKSIKLKGLRQPLLVWQLRVSKKEKSEYFLLGGFRRHAAINAIRGEDTSQFEKIPVLKWAGTLEEAQFEVLCDNLNRENPALAQAAGDVAQLKSLGHTQTKIAEKLGMSGSWVSRMLKFQKNADKDLKKAVDAGEVPMDAAQEIATDPSTKKARSAKEQKQLTKEAKKDTKKGKSAKKKVEKKDKKANKRKTRVSRPSKSELEEALKRCPEGELDAVTEAASTAFEFALRYACGEMGLEKALAAAGIIVEAATTEPEDTSEPPDMGELVPEVEDTEAVEEVVEEVVDGDVKEDDDEPREGEDEDGNEDSIPF